MTIPRDIARQIPKSNLILQIDRSPGARFTNALMNVGTLLPNVAPVRPVALWRLGLDALDYSDNGLHGSVISGVIMGLDFGVKDGLPSSKFDGNQAHINLPVTTLSPVFPRNEGSIGIYAKIDPSARTDGVQHYCFRVGVDGNNYVSIWKSTADNAITVDYRAGGTVIQRQVGNIIDDGWMFFVMTYSKQNDRVKIYKNSVQIGLPTLTGLGTFSTAPLAQSVTAISGIVANDQFWKGWLAFCVIWPVELLQSQLDYLKQYL